MQPFFKDSDPLTTVRRARQLLAQVGLFPVESGWTETSSCFSCRLEDIELGYGTNGKGLSRPLALASAYGEFLERLQNLVLIPSRFGIMPEVRFSFPDETTAETQAVCERLPELMRATLSDAQRAARLCPQGWRSLPYYDATADREELVPLFAQYACGTNGLCAGNTPEEALTEGLCEVAERFVTRRVLAGEADLPTIAHDRLGSAAAVAMVQSMTSSGFEVIVKDASMGGRFPVVGTILTDAERTFALFRFGSSPLFDIALQRCLTETFQGLRSLDRIAARHAFDLKPHTPFAEELPDPQSRSIANEHGFLRAGLGRLPPAAILSIAESCHERVFLREWRGNRHALRFMLDCFGRDGAQVLIRDYSLLGFPAYRVIVPGRTELLQFGRDVPLEDSLSSEPGSATQLRRGLLQLNRQSPAEISELIRTFERQQERPIFHFETRFSWPGWFHGLLGLNAPSTDLLTAMTSLPRLLAMLALRCGDLERAERYLRKHLVEVPQDVTSYSTACLAYLVRRNQGCSHAEAVHALTGFFGAELADEVAEDLGSQDNAFAHVVLPDCGECGSCPIRGECQYDVWKQRASSVAKLVERFHPEHKGLRALCRAG